MAKVPNTAPGSYAAARVEHGGRVRIKIGSGFGHEADIKQLMTAKVTDQAGLGRAQFYSTGTCLITRFQIVTKRIITI